MKTQAEKQSLKDEIKAILEAYPNLSQAEFNARLETVSKIHGPKEIIKAAVSVLIASTPHGQVKVKELGAWLSNAAKAQRAA